MLFTVENIWKTGHQNRRKSPDTVEDAALSLRKGGTASRAPGEEGAGVRSPSPPLPGGHTGCWAEGRGHVGAPSGGSSTFWRALFRGEACGGPPLREWHGAEGRSAFHAEITYQQAQRPRPHPHASQSSCGPQQSSSFDLLLLNFLCC